MLFDLNINILKQKQKRFRFRNIYNKQAKKCIFHPKNATLTLLSDLKKLIFFKNILHTLFLCTKESFEGVSRYKLKLSKISATLLVTM